MGSIVAQGVTQAVLQLQGCTLIFSSRSAWQQAVTLCQCPPGEAMLDLAHRKPLAAAAPLPPYQLRAAPTLLHRRS